jgi:tetratricopeptide (TPR) repeat protein
LTNIRPVDPEAHEAFLKGRYFIHKFIEADVRKGISYFEQAIARDSNYALAYAGLAEGYDYLWTLGTIKSKDAFPIIKKYSMRALSIDGTLADPYAVLGDIELAQRNFESSERNYKRAVELNQNYAIGHAYYAWYLLMMKRYDEALNESRLAVELDPLWPLTKVIFSMSLYYNHKYDSAMTQVREALSIDSNFALGYAYLGDFYLWQRNYEEAIEQFQTGAAHGDSSGLALVAYCYTCLGNPVKAREIITDLKIIYMTFHGLAYMGLGEWDRTFEWFERAYEEYDLTLLMMISLPNGFDANFDSLRADPRFHALVKKMGLEK